MAPQLYPDRTYDNVPAINIKHFTCVASCASRIVRATQNNTAAYGFASDVTYCPFSVRIDAKLTSGGYRWLRRRPWCISDTLHLICTPSLLSFLTMPHVAFADVFLIRRDKRPEEKEKDNYRLNNNCSKMTTHRNTVVASNTDVSNLFAFRECSCDAFRPIIQI